MIEDVRKGDTLSLHGNEGSRNGVLSASRQRQLLQQGIAVLPSTNVPPHALLRAPSQEERGKALSYRMWSASHLNDPADVIQCD